LRFSKATASVLILDRIDAQSGCAVKSESLTANPVRGVRGLRFGVSSFNAAGVGSCHSGDRWYRGVTTSATAGKSGGGEKLNHERPNRIRKEGLASKILRRRCQTVNIRLESVPRASGFVGGNPIDSCGNCFNCCPCQSGKYGMPEGSTYPSGPDGNTS
jgi:hypothetical protein